MVFSTNFKQLIFVVWITVHVQINGTNHSVLLTKGPFTLARPIENMLRVILELEILSIWNIPGKIGTSWSSTSLPTHYITN